MASSDLSDFSMLGLFRMEVESQMDKLSAGLLALESNPSRVEDVESMMRAAHSIKGAARIVQLDPAVSLAHAMEDCFVAVQDGKLTLTEGGVDALLRGVDLFSQSTQLQDETQIEAWFTAQQSQIDDLIASYQDILTGEPLAASASVAPAAPETRETPAAPRVPAAPAAPAAPVPDLSSESAASPGAAPEPKASHPDSDSFVRVTAEKLNRLMGLAGEALVEVDRFANFEQALLQLKKDLIATSDAVTKLSRADSPAAGALAVQQVQVLIQHNQTALSQCLSGFSQYSRRLDRFSDQLYREVLASKMRPFADGVKAFPRMVRDLAKSLGKKVTLVVSGEDTDVDRDILEKLEAPLNHLLRNAMDHGLETPAERTAAGKDPTGTIRLEAKHRAGMLHITVADDGRGIDIAKLRAKVVAKKLIEASLAASLSEPELLEFLFLPGFSTAASVSEISGRGVGLDVVQHMVHDVRGLIKIETAAARGTTFNLQLPVTLSVLRTLIVDISGQTYAIPLARIDQVLELNPAEIMSLESHQYIKCDPDNVGLVAASQLLELPETALKRSSIPVVIVSDRLNRYALSVDRFLGERDLVVRPLDPRLGAVADVNAAAILEDGSVVLIMDVDDVVRSIHNLIGGGRCMAVGNVQTDADATKRKRILVVDDSITVREVERKLLENHHYEVEVAVDGVDGWNAIRSAAYDLVLTDVDMPRMNGIELVNLIKSNAKLKSIPVMIVSYKDREADRIRGLDAGADFYLTKSSFHDNSLLDAVRDLIGEAQP